MKKYRVGIITDKGLPISKNVATRDEVDDFILEIMEKEGVKLYRVMDRETGEIIETEKGRRN